MHTVAEIPTFQARAKAAGMSDEDLDLLVEMVSRRPSAGSPIQGTGGARKVRLARAGAGKSGGFRILTYFTGEDLPVFLVSVLAKNQKANFSHAERNTIRDLLAGLAEDYRRGVMTNVRIRQAADQ